jgi:hypothetical protein
MNAAAKFAVRVSETAIATDSVLAVQQFLCLIQESITASDIVFARFLWELINDSQNANWATIDDSETVTWATIGASQSAGWSTIDTAESAGWATIDDSSPTTWTDIATT